MLQINFLAALVSAIFSMILGFMWYGPMLFSNLWMKESGLTDADVKNGPGIGYLLTMVAAFVTASVTSLLVHMLHITDVGQGALLGLTLGLGYVATTFASNYIFGQKSFKLYLIDAGYQIINIVGAGVITTLIR